LGLGVDLKLHSELQLDLSIGWLSLRDGFEEIRARGGLAVFKDVFGLEHKDLRKDILPLFRRLQKTSFFPPTATRLRLYGASELPFDTIAGPAYDVLALDGSDACERLWFNLLNDGYPVSAIGAGGGSLEGGRLPFGQTFVHGEGAPDAPAVQEAIKKGRTAISFGPAAFCTIVERNMGPGSILPADGRALTLQIQAYASLQAGAQIDRVDVIRNGALIQSHRASEGEAQIHDLRCAVSERNSAWYVVRVTERAQGQKNRRAWTSPIFFKGTACGAPEPARCRVTGVLRRELTPIEGTVTAVVPGQPSRQVSTDAAGSFKIELAASGTLVFAAPGCEPQAQRIIDQPAVRKAMAALQVEHNGTLPEQLAKSSLFAAWRLLVAELECNVTLQKLQPVEGR
jgi:hypothetical protein